MLGFVLLGAISTPLNRSKLRDTRWFAVALAVLLSAHATRALAITRHGGALKEYGDALLELEEATDALKELPSEPLADDDGLRG